VQPPKLLNVGILEYSDQTAYRKRVENSFEGRNNRKGEITKAQLIFDSGELLIENTL
jgi:hypothetical protein